MGVLDKWLDTEHCMTLEETKRIGPDEIRGCASQDVKYRKGCPGQAVFGA